MTSTLHLSSRADYGRPSSHSIRSLALLPGLVLALALTGCGEDAVEPPVNAPPVAEAGGPYTGARGGAVTLTGSGSDPDPGGTIVRFGWDLDGDGAYDDASTAEAEYACAAGGEHTVALEVEDDQGATGTDDAVVTCSDAVPAADAGGPYLEEIAADVALEGAATDDGEIVAWDWDLDGDGVHDDASGVTATFTCAVAGETVIGLRVTDDAGQTGTASSSVECVTRDRILFTSYRNDSADLYTMNPDGSEVLRLTDDGAQDHHASWSRSGERIAFVSNRAGGRDIWVMDPLGRGQVRLSTHDGDDTSPVWSPDGQRIAFMSAEAGGNWEIAIRSADGSGDRVVVASDPEPDQSPRWSPDGSRIVFYRGVGSAAEIWSVGADGTDLVRLTDNDTADAYPEWSPDGTRILFQRIDRTTGKVGLYVMSPDGSGLMPLTAHDGSFEGRWSPDGTRIAFTSERDGNSEIYVMDADGTDATRLTDDPARDWDPRWSADGTRIIFTSERPGGTEIFVVGADGGGLENLTQLDGPDSTASWRP